VTLTATLPSARRLSEQCFILDISQPYRLLRPVMGQLYFTFFIIVAHVVAVSCQIHIQHCSM
jgi:hypothetical protein